jgi:hypothetical protein
MDNNNGNSKIGIYIFIIIFTVLAILALYYILSLPAGFFYPKSPFTAGQTVVISPAVLSDVNIVNQYLTFLNPSDGTSCYNYSGSATQAGWNMSDTDCVVTFTGTNASQESNQWVLMETNANGENSTNQSLQYGYGNRFYLKNKAYADNDIKGRIRFSQSSNLDGRMCPSSTSSVAGGTCSEFLCAYQEQLIVYFYPTNFPDIYYLLFPGINGGSGYNSENDGIISARPWSAPSPSNQISNGCPNNAEFYPYCLSYVDSCTDTISKLNANSMLMNALVTPGSPSPYNNYPNVYLFRVTGI